MKILYFLFALFIMCNQSYAKPLNEMSANTSPDITNDFIYSQDVSDTSENSHGTGKSLTIKNAFKAANITIDGTNVGINSVNPTATLDVGGTVNATAFTGDGSGLTGVAASASDDAYGVTWNGDTTGIASKNALYDKIETISVGGSGINWDSYDAISSVSNDYQFLVNASGTNKDINWENLQQISGFDASIIYNVKQYGAKGDGITKFDGAITSGTNDFTSASASFTSSDVGKVITITNGAAASSDLTTTISAYVSATAVTLATNATNTVTDAVFTYGTDDTTAIRNAVAAVGNANPPVGTVYFPSGIYIVNGAFDQTNNSQIAFPTKLSTSTPYFMTTVKLQGPIFPKSTNFYGYNAGGAIIYSTKNGSAGNSVFSGKGTGGASSFTDIRVDIEDLTVRTVQNPTNSAINLAFINTAIINGLYLEAGTVLLNSITQPTGSSSTGLIMPGTQNNNVTFLTNARIQGFYTGLSAGEHTSGHNVDIFYSVNGLSFSSSVHDAFFSDLGIERTINNIVCSGSASFIITNVDMENAGSSSGSWYENVYDYKDTSSQCTGSITYFIQATEGGSTTFTIDGGKKVSIFGPFQSRYEFVTQSSYPTFALINKGTSSSTNGAIMTLVQDDGAATASGDRLGSISYGGAYNTTGSRIFGSSVSSFADETYSSTAAGSHLRFNTTAIGGSSPTERVRITNSGNVGIGTINPSKELHVTGDARITGLVSCDTIDTDSSGNLSCGTDDGGSGSIGIGTANTITFWPTTTTIGSLPTATYPSLTELSYVKGATSNIQTQIDGLSVGSGGWTDGGTNVYNSTTSDNIGIGTTTPNSGFKLDVRGNQYLFGNIGIGTLSPRANIDINSLYVTDISGPSGNTILGMSNNVGIGTTTLTSGMKLDVRGSQYVSGNVGVGTTIPSANLMVVGSTANVFKLVSTTASASNGGAGIQSWNDDGAAVVSGDRLAFYTFGGSYNGTNGLGSGAAISGFAEGTYSASSYPTEVRIETAPSGSTTRTARVYVKSTGNVGIGSATPGQALDVQGTVRATAFSGDGSALTGISAGGWVDGGTNVYVSPTTDNVGIGTTTPSTNFKADIRGNLYVSGNVGIGTLLPRGTLDLGPTGTVYAQTITGPTGPTILGTSNNVGIGTITAGALLTVGSTGQVTVSSAGAVATSSTVSVADDAYAAGWNGSTVVPTKNAVYDKIETLGAGYWTDAGVFTYLTTTTDNVGIGTVAPDQRLKVEGGSAANVSAMVRNSDSSGLASVKVWNSANLGFEMVATGSGYAIPSTYGVLATAGESLSFGESDGTINMRINPAGTVRFTPTDTPDTCNAGNEGSLYYDNSLNEFCDCDGSSWAQVDGGGAC